MHLSDKQTPKSTIKSKCKLTNFLIISLASIIEHWGSVIDFQGYKSKQAAELGHEFGSNAPNPMLCLKLSCALVFSKPV